MVQSNGSRIRRFTGVYAKDVAEVLDIHPIILFRWKKEYREGEIMKKPGKGITVEVSKGDVFIIPALTAHQLINPGPDPLIMIFSCPQPTSLRIGTW
ncbi:MAG: glucose-6-phosphate isomerase family protein [Sedimenticola sp.]